MLERQKLIYNCSSSIFSCRVPSGRENWRPRWDFYPSERDKYISSQYGSCAIQRAFFKTHCKRGIKNSRRFYSIPSHKAKFNIIRESFDRKIQLNFALFRKNVNFEISIFNLPRGDEFSSTLDLSSLIKTSPFAICYQSRVNVFSLDDELSRVFHMTLRVYVSLKNVKHRDKR
ncbi:hypothetical protein PUN28_014713 [Cardiocondyla obscurior]|uniref:Uncharacterized protein n=1 Tax=Cardiocondyla obscurior TaxID=286306 RepID=A0AAW2F130_9HYME